MKKIFLLMFLIPVLCYSQNQRSITVRGIAEKEIEPDRVELTIVFLEIENIKKENELKIKEGKLKNLVKSFSIDIKNLTIDNLSASKYGYYKTATKRIRMSKVFKLQIDKIDIIDSLIVKLFEIGADDVTVTNLQSKQLEKMKLETIKLAIDNAKTKANTIAAHTENSLDQIIAIKEYNPEIKISNEDDHRLYAKGLLVHDGSPVSSDNSIGIRKIRVVYVVDVEFELK